MANIPTTAELLARMRKEMGHCLNIKQAAQAHYDALDAMCKGLGNTKRDALPVTEAKCESLTRARGRTVDSVRALVAYVNEEQ